VVPHGQQAAELKLHGGAHGQEQTGEHRDCASAASRDAIVPETTDATTLTPMRRARPPVDGA